MEQKVWLTIRGEQDYAGAGCDSTSQRLPGTMAATAQGILLRYEERDDAGAATHTALALEDGRAVLTRTGAVKTEMIFEPGRAHRSAYALSFGALPVTVEAERVAWKRTAQGLIAELRYRIDLGGQKGTCSLRIQARAAE